MPATGAANSPIERIATRQPAPNAPISDQATIALARPPRILLWRSATPTSAATTAGTATGTTTPRPFTPTSVAEAGSPGAPDGTESDAESYTGTTNAATTSAAPHANAATVSQTARRPSTTRAEVMAPPYARRASRSVRCVNDSGHDRILRRVFDAQAESFNRSAVANDGRLLDELVALGAPRRTERWLDAACGPGIVSRRLASVTGAVHGIDLTPAMIDVARREATAAGIENATFEVGDATATGHADDSFDGAMTRFSVHHLPAPGRLLDELARVVRPGGRVVVADHLADDDADAAAWSQEIERLRDPSHWACLTATRLRALGDDAGLTLDDERRRAFELDLDDWLGRGAAEAGARALVQRLLAERPSTARCFGVRERDGRRVLALQLWLGRWCVRDG